MTPTSQTHRSYVWHFATMAVWSGANLLAADWQGDPRAQGRIRTPIPHSHISLPVRQLERNDAWHHHRPSYEKLMELNKKREGQPKPPIDVHIQPHRIVVENGNHRVMDAQLRHQEWIHAKPGIIPLPPSRPVVRQREAGPKYVPPRQRTNPSPVTAFMQPHADVPPHSGNRHAFPHTTESGVGMPQHIGATSAPLRGDTHGFPPAFRQQHADVPPH